MDIGTLLRNARESALLSQVDLAQRAGTSRAAVQAYEHGRVSPTVRAVDRLLAAMGLQLRPVLEPLLADVDERVDALEPFPEYAETLAHRRQWLRDRTD